MNPSSRVVVLSAIGFTIYILYGRKQIERLIFDGDFASGKKKLISPGSFNLKLNEESSINRLTSFPKSFAGSRANWFSRISKGNVSLPEKMVFRNEWFVFSAATNQETSRMSMNACYQLFRYGVKQCNLIAATSEALQATDFLKTKIALEYNIINFTKEYEWTLELVARSNYSIYNSICLLREFLKMDMLLAGYHVWMFDSDVIFPSSPLDDFIDLGMDIVILSNIGSFPQTGIGSYSYPFLAKIDGSELEATLNNGIISIKSTKATRIYCTRAMKRILSHPLGDPQHPPNKLIFDYGLRLREITEYVWEGHLRINDSSEYLANEEEIISCRALTYPSGYELGSGKSCHDLVDENITTLHLTGIGGLSGDQGRKIIVLKECNFWFLEN